MCLLLKAGIAGIYRPSGIMFAEHKAGCDDLAVMESAIEGDIKSECRLGKGGQLVTSEVCCSVSQSVPPSSCSDSAHIRT